MFTLDPSSNSEIDYVNPGLCINTLNSDNESVNNHHNVLSVKLFIAVCTLYSSIRGKVLPEVFNKHSIPSGIEKIFKCLHTNRKDEARWRKFNLLRVIYYIKVKLLATIFQFSFLVSNLPGRRLGKVFRNETRDYAIFGCIGRPTTADSHWNWIVKWGFWKNKTLVLCYPNCIQSALK